jgi:hypothetical protein
MKQTWEGKFNAPRIVQERKMNIAVSFACCNLLRGAVAVVAAVTFAARLG